MNNQAQTPSIYTYTVELNGETFTGTVKANTRSDAGWASRRAAQKQMTEETDAPKLHIIWALNEETFKVERNPVLHNMLTGEKIVGPAGMSECQLFGMMAAGII